jgi:glutathione S-transferase
LRPRRGPTCSARSLAWQTQCSPLSASRFTTYDVELDPVCTTYRTIMSMPVMQEWIEGARAEPDEVEELDVEF